jgi:hypothetical protein
MGTDAVWRIVNTTAQPVVSSLGLELSAFHRARRLELRLDGRTLGTLDVEPPRRMYEIGPFTLRPGGHELLFRPVEEPTVPRDVVGGADTRPLSFAIGTWTWTVRGDQP